MKTIFFKQALLFTVLCIFAVACEEPVNGSSSNGNSILGNGGIAVPDPEGTIVVSMRNENQGKTTIDLFDNGYDIYIDKGDNFVCNSYNIEFCIIGEVEGLGNVRSAPESGWTSKVAVMPGYGYMARCRIVSGDGFYYRYARLYVVEYVLSISTEILGAKVKYQSPFIPENDENILNNVPDEGFKNLLLSYYDDNSDGIITKEEALNIHSIVSYITTEKISSLAGIESFSNLDTLIFCNSDLSSLDISKLKSLDWLICINNKLTSLDVSELESLDYLDCSNNQLSTLKLDDGPLTNLNCSNNQLQRLELGNLKYLSNVNCSQNQLTYIWIGFKSSDIGDISINCSDNLLSSIDVSYCKSLYKLDCSNNSLAELDLSNNQALTFLYCENNLLSELDLSVCGTMSYYFDGRPYTKDSQQIYAYCKNNPNLHTIYLSASIPQYSEDMIDKDDFTTIAYK